MTNKLLVPMMLLALLTAHCETEAASEKSKSADSQQPALPYSPSLNVSSMDQSVNPCVDFYHYSCGGWQKTNAIPPDQTSWSIYGKLAQDNLVFLKEVLEQAAKPGSPRDPETQKIGDYYASCMDEAAVEKRGIRAIKPLLDAVDALQSVKQIASMAATLQ